MEELAVIIEWNQASGQPRVADDTVYTNPAEAREQAAALTQASRDVGRRERYTVATLDTEMSHGG